MDTSIKQNTSDVTFNRYPEIGEPLVSNLCYTVKHATSKNVITFHCSEFGKMIANYKKKELSLFYTCIKHKHNLKPVENCNYCVEFLKFPYAFNVVTSFYMFTFPPPCMWAKINENLFCAIIKKSVDNLKLIENRSKKSAKETEKEYYNYFCQKSLIGGTYKTQISGKNSIIRKKVLSFHANGLRLTLTIDSTLGPNYIVLPKSILKDLNLATMFVIINRAPSINSKCIYVCEILINKDENDNTVHLNSFIVNGLGADQDGDEINVNFFEKDGEIPSFELNSAILELKSMSWKYGCRHTSIYEPRYSISQHVKFILYLCDEKLKIQSPLWQTLKGSISQKCNILMNLGCSILQTEVNDFIENIVCNLVRINSVVDVPVNELVQENGILSSVVNSGAKGTNDHITTYLTNLHEENVNKFTKKCVDGFNKYIKNSVQMSREGTNQFILLKAMTSIGYYNNTISGADVVLVKNVKNSASFCTILYNHIAFEWLNEQFLLEEF